MENGTCGTCGQPLERGASIYVADAGPRCFDCRNRELAAELGVRFDDTPLEPIVMKDADGMAHTFAVRSLLVPTGREMIASEVPPPDRGGYEFRILGDFDARARDLLGHLCAKIRREIAVRHVERADGRWRLTEGDAFSGRIEWDPDSGDGPVVVVDGKPFTWDELGRLLMTYEGFTLHGRIEDSIEVVGGPLLEPDSRADGEE